MNEKIQKIIKVIENDGNGREFRLKVNSLWTVCAEAWLEDNSITRYYYEYYVFYDGDIEFTTTDRSKFVSYIEKLV